MSWLGRFSSSHSAGGEEKQHTPAEPSQSMSRKSGSMSRGQGADDEDLEGAPFDFRLPVSAIITDPRGIDCLVTFARRQGLYSVQFWVEVERFRAVQDKSILTNRARQLYSTYVADNAPERVALPTAVYNGLTMALELDDINPFLFNAAQTSTLRDDIVPKVTPVFMQSDAYMRLVDRLMVDLAMSMDKGFSDHRIPLLELVSNPVGAQLVRQFLQTLQEEKLIDFYLSVDAYRTRSLSGLERSKGSKDIYKRYVHPKSEFSVCERKSLARTIKNVIVALSGPGGPPANVFDALQQLVWRRMNDLYPLLIKSDFYKDAMQYIINTYRSDIAAQQTKLDMKREERGLERRVSTFTQIDLKTKQKYEWILNQGAVFQKYGSHKKPHWKYVKFTDDGEIHYQDSPPSLSGTPVLEPGQKRVRVHKSLKRIHIRDVEGILEGKQTASWNKASGARSIPADLCWSVVASSRTLDLQAASNEQRDNWIGALKWQLQRFKGKGVGTVEDEQKLAERDETMRREAIKAQIQPVLRSPPSGTDFNVAVPGGKFHEQRQDLTVPMGGHGSSEAVARLSAAALHDEVVSSADDSSPGRRRMMMGKQQSSSGKDLPPPPPPVHGLSDDTSSSDEIDAIPPPPKTKPSVHSVGSGLAGMTTGLALRKAKSKKTLGRKQRGTRGVAGSSDSESPDDSSHSASEKSDWSIPSDPEQDEQDALREAKRKLKLKKQGTGTGARKGRPAMRRANTTSGTRAGLRSQSSSTLGSRKPALKRATSTSGSTSTGTYVRKVGTFSSLKKKSPSAKPRRHSLEENTTAAHTGTFVRQSSAPHLKRASSKDKKPRTLAAGRGARRKARMDVKKAVKASTMSSAQLMAHTRKKSPGLLKKKKKTKKSSLSDTDMMETNGVVKQKKKKKPKAERVGEASAPEDSKDDASEDDNTTSTGALPAFRPPVDPEKPFVPPKGLPNLNLKHLSAQSGASSSELTATETGNGDGDEEKEQQENKTGVSRQNTQSVSLAAVMPSTTEDEEEKATVRNEKVARAPVAASRTGAGASALQKKTSKKGLLHTTQSKPKYSKAASTSMLMGHAVKNKASSKVASQSGEVNPKRRVLARSRTKTHIKPVARRANSAGSVGTKAPRKSRTSTGAASTSSSKKKTTKKKVHDEQAAAAAAAAATSKVTAGEHSGEENEHRDMLRQSSTPVFGSLHDTSNVTPGGVALSSPLGSTSYAGTVWRVCAPSGLWVRSGPNTTAGLLTMLQHEETFVEIARENNWVQHGRGWSMAHDTQSGQATAEVVSSAKESLQTIQREYDDSTAVADATRDGVHEFSMSKSQSTRSAQSTSSQDSQQQAAGPLPRRDSISLAMKRGSLRGKLHGVRLGDSQEDVSIVEDEETGVSGGVGVGSMKVREKLRQQQEKERDDLMRQFDADHKIMHQGELSRRINSFLMVRRFKKGYWFLDDQRLWETAPGDRENVLFSVALIDVERVHHSQRKPRHVALVLQGGAKETFEAPDVESAKKWALALSRGLLGVTGSPTADDTLAPMPALVRRASMSFMPDDVVKNVRSADLTLYSGSPINSMDDLSVIGKVQRTGSASGAAAGRGLSRKALRYLLARPHSTTGRMLENQTLPDKVVLPSQKDTESTRASEHKSKAPAAVKVLSLLQDEFLKAVQAGYHATHHPLAFMNVALPLMRTENNIVIFLLETILDPGKETRTLPECKDGEVPGDMAAGLSPLDRSKLRHRRSNSGSTTDSSQTPPKHARALSRGDSRSNSTDNDESISEWRIKVVKTGMDSPRGVPPSQLLALRGTAYLWAWTEVCVESLFHLLARNSTLTALVLRVLHLILQVGAQSQATHTCHLKEFYSRRHELRTLAVQSSSLGAHWSGSYFRQLVGKTVLGLASPPSSPPLKKKVTKATSSLKNSSSSGRLGSRRADSTGSGAGGKKRRAKTPQQSMSLQLSASQMRSLKPKAKSKSPPGRQGAGGKRQKAFGHSRSVSTLSLAAASATRKAKTTKGSSLMSHNTSSTHASVLNKPIRSDTSNTLSRHKGKLAPSTGSGKLSSKNKNQQHAKEAADSYGDDNGPASPTRRDTKMAGVASAMCPACLRTAQTFSEHVSGGCGGPRFTHRVRRALTFMLVSEPDKWYTMDSTATVFNTPVVQASVWKVLFVALHDSALPIRVQTMQDVNALLVRSMVNRDSLLMQSGWQEWIVPLLKDIRVHDVERTDLERTVYSLVMNVLVLLCSRACVSSARFEATVVSVIRCFQSQWEQPEESELFSHALFKALLSDLRLHRAAFPDYDRQHTSWLNALVLLHLLKVYMFETPTKPDAIDSWSEKTSDLSILAKALGLGRRKSRVSGTNSANSSSASLRTASSPNLRGGEKPRDSSGSASASQLVVDRMASTDSIDTVGSDSAPAASLGGLGVFANLVHSDSQNNKVPGARGRSREQLAAPGMPSAAHDRSPSPVRFGDQIAHGLHYDHEIRRCADRDLADMAHQLLKVLCIEDLPQYLKLNPDMSPRDKRFLQKLQSEREFFTDTIQFLHVMNVGCEILTATEVDSAVDSFLKASSTKYRLKVMDGLQKDARLVEPLRILTELEEREEQRRKAEQHARDLADHQAEIKNSMQRRASMRGNVPRGSVASRSGLYRVSSTATTVTQTSNSLDSSQMTRGSSTLSDKEKGSTFDELPHELKREMEAKRGERYSKDSSVGYKDSHRGSPSDSSGGSDGGVLGHGKEDVEAVSTRSTERGRGSVEPMRLPFTAT